MNETLLHRDDRSHFLKLAHVQDAFARVRGGK